MNIFEIQKVKGPSVLGPLKTSSERVSYYAAFNGCPVLKNGKWGQESSFDTEEAAMSFSQRYAKEVEGWK